MQPILVVDDDLDIRDVLSDALEDEGFEVSTAANGREALRCIGVEEPALVLLDLQMPGMNGTELLTTLRAAQLTMPVVLMSADPQAARVADSGQADGYLAKPFDLAAVLATVEQLTARPG